MAVGKQQGLLTQPRRFATAFLRGVSRGAFAMSLHPKVVAWVNEHGASSFASLRERHARSERNLAVAVLIRQTGIGPIGRSRRNMLAGCLQ